jgi:hypothetical protein
MGERAITGVVAIITAILGVAIVAVILSQKSATSNVISAGGSALSSVLGTALSPVSGGNVLGGITGFGNVLNGLNNTLPVISA